MPASHLSSSSGLGFQFNALLMYLGNQWKVAQVFGTPANHVGDPYGVSGSWLQLSSALATADI